MTDENENTEATPAVDTLPDDEASAVVEQPVDPVETTGNDTPVEPVSDIEAAAAAAAEADPEPEPEPDPEPEPEPEVEAAPKPAKGKAPASERTKVKPRKRDKTTATIQAHLAQLKKNRPEAEPAPEPTDDEKAAADAKAEKRARLDEIVLELAELDELREALIAEQSDLVNLKPVKDERTFHEKLQATQKRGVEIRQQRQRDRLKLLAKSADKSPLDQALSGRPRNRPDIEANPPAANE